MRRLLRILVATASVVVALMSIASLWYRLNEARISGERSSGAEYSILRNALNSIQSDADLQDQILRNRLQSLYKGSDRLMAVQVLDSGGLVVWKMPAESAYFALPNQAGTRLGFSAPTWSTIVYSTPLSGDMKLVALYATVLRSDFAYSAKLPLLLAGAWFLLACLAALLLRKDKVPVKDSATPSESAPTPESEIMEASSEEENEVDREALAVSETIDEVPDSPEPPEPPEPGPLPLQPGSSKGFEESLAKLEEEVIEWSSRRNEERKPRTELSEEDSETDEDEIDAEDSMEATETVPDSSEETTLEDSLETLQEFEELNAEEEKESEPELPNLQESTPEPEYEAQMTPQPRIPAAAQPNDLSDLPMPLSLSEPGIESRLSQELARSDRSEVSLMLIHCSIGGPTDPAGIALAATMKDYIGSRELIFEMYKGAFAVILPSVDLGGALKMSEDLSDVLATTLGLYRDIEGDAPVYIGISARSERPVDAYKLYREASTAVHKAFSGGHSRILAFRPKSA
jgi:hypothetical protein